MELKGEYVAREDEYFIWLNHGEHGDFSRVLLYLSGAGDWRVRNWWFGGIILPSSKDLLLESYIPMMVRNGLQINYDRSILPPEMMGIIKALEVMENL